MPEEVELDARLRARLAEVMAEAPTRAVRLGSASVRLDTEHGRRVLRRPRGPGEDLHQEQTWLRGLRVAGIRAPECLTVIPPGDAGDTAALLLEWVEGDVLADGLSRATRHNTQLLGELSSAIVEGLEALHDVDPSACGMPMPDPDTVLASEVARAIHMWNTQPLHRMQAAHDLIARLQRSVPERPSALSIIHGDLHLGHVVLRAGPEPEVVAFLDWEHARISDPLVDLGVLLARWTDSEDDPLALALDGLAVSRADGFFSRATVTHEYASGRPVPLDHIAWYACLGYLIVATDLAQRNVRSGAATTERLVDEVLQAALVRAQGSHLAGLSR